MQYKSFKILQPFFKKTWENVLMNILLNIFWQLKFRSTYWYILLYVILFITNGSIYMFKNNKSLKV